MTSLAGARQFSTLPKHRWKPDLETVRLELVEALGLAKCSSHQGYLTYLETMKPAGLELDKFLVVFCNMIYYFEGQKNESPLNTRPPNFGLQHRREVQSVDDNDHQPSVDAIPASLNTMQEHTIRAYINSLHESGYLQGCRNMGLEGPQCWKQVADTVFGVLGLWLAMPSFFEPRLEGVRPIELAYQFQCRRNNRPIKDILDCTISGLVRDCQLVPPPVPFVERIWEGTWVFSESQTLREGANSEDRAAVMVSCSPWGTSHPKALQGTITSEQDIYAPLDMLESANISAKALNVGTLSKYGAVSIHWTRDICRHLVLSKRLGRTVLEVFAFPSVLQGHAPPGLDADFLLEVEASYPLLFHPEDDKRHSGVFSVLTGRKFWCVCSTCYLRHVTTKAILGLKHQKSHLSPHIRGHGSGHAIFDSAIEGFIEPQPHDWNPEKFRCLWPRVRALQDFQHVARPWSLWILFQDRRDTAQWWMFLLAVIIIPLTTLQVVLGLIQVVQCFLN